MKSDRELMRIHIEALFTYDAAGRLHRVNEPGGAVAPRFFLGRTAEGHEWRFRHDVSRDLVQALEALCQDEPIAEDISHPGPDPRAYRRLLAQHAPIQSEMTGPAYCFPDDLSASEAIRVTSRNADVLRPHFGEWIGDVAPCQPFYALLRDGCAVSVCGSVRKTSQAYEAGVETAHDFRGQGYAAQVVSAWAHTVRQMGLIPLYSTSWQNTSSQAVARKLGLIQYGADLHMT